MNAETCCSICGGDLPAAKPTGRPKSYCSAPCRRAAEYEVARIDRELAHVLRLETWLLTKGTEEDAGFYDRLCKREQRLEGRLLALLGGGPIRWAEDEAGSDAE